MSVKSQGLAHDQKPRALLGSVVDGLTFTVGLLGKEFELMIEEHRQRKG